jgi:Flp pilus assembly protein TadB
VIWLVAAALLALALAPWDVHGALARRRAGHVSRLALPAFVESLGAALGAGLSLELAFAEIAPTMPVPLADRGRRAAAMLRLGGSLDEALSAFDGAVPAQDLAGLRLVLGSFHRAGGPVRRRLGRVAALLRGRLALEEEHAALTAQGRVSAVVLIALAPLGALLFAILMPSYAGTLLGHGLPLVLIAVVLEIAGALWLARIVRAPAERHELASLLDAVVIGLDAGLTFEQSLRALVDRAPKLARIPDARRLLADFALGQGRARAFARFASCGPDEARVSGLVGAATRLGAPLAELLVAQADALRESERRRAEARARRLPVLMLFPLTFCVLPALLIVFLGPPLLSLGG